MTTRGGGRVRGGVAGETGFFRMAENAEEIIVNMARPKLEEAAGVGAAVAFRRAAVRTGEMRDSIEHGTRKRGNTIEAYISVGTDHWQFVEYGTGMRGIDTNPEAGVQSQGYHHGSTKGMPARPFMRPGLLAMGKAFRGQ